MSVKAKQEKRKMRMDFWKRYWEKSKKIHKFEIKINDEKHLFIEDDQRSRKPKKNKKTERKEKEMKRAR